MSNLLTSLITGKYRSPDTAKINPVYDLSDETLAEKETIFFRKTANQHINEYGCLLYKSCLPFTDPMNYSMSHKLSDFPAWHGHWMASLAFKQAVEPSDEISLLLRKSIEGLHTSFLATGIPGLLPRSYIKHDGDEPLWWMLDKLEDKRPTMFWQKGENGFWFRNGVSKDQYCGAVFGLAVAICLIENNAILLPSETKALLYATFIKIAHYIIDNDYKIIDANGKQTEFGDLSNGFTALFGDFGNGFNALQTLAILRTGLTIGDDKCTKEYNKAIDNKIDKMISKTLGLLGCFYARIGRENAFGHFSDDQAIYTNAFVLFFNSEVMPTDSDNRVFKNVDKALRKIWKYLRYSQKSYITLVHHIMIGVPVHRYDQAIYTLRLYPIDKREITNLKKRQTHKIQPIPNQDISAHYWKSNYFKKATLTEDSARLNVEFAYQDFLSIYWIGRYFNLIKRG